MSAEPKKDHRDYRWILGLTALFLALGLAYVQMVPPGLPYDEPSHFSIVQMNSQLNGLPAVGRNGATYEACQPPLYYFLAGIVYRIVSPSVDAAHAFYFCRLLTLIIASPLVLLTYEMAREFSGRRSVAQLAGVLVAVNPAILGIAASIQNDSLAFLLATLASIYCIRWCVQRTLCPHRTLIVSLLIAAAIMTKSSTLSLLPLFALITCWAYGAKAIWRLAIFASVLAITTGWWFLRNHQLYGDFSGAQSVNAVFGAQVGGAKFHLLSPGDWLWAIRGIITTYTVPVGYWRNEVKNPLWITAAIGVGISSMILGLIPSIRRRRLPGAPPGKSRILMTWAAIFVVLCLGLWLLISSRHFLVAARVAMPAMAATILLAAAALCDLRNNVAVLFSRRFLITQPMLIAVLILPALAANVQLLRHAAGLVNRPYMIRLDQP